MTPLNLTEHKQAEEALRESEEKYRTLIDNIQDGVFIIQDAKVRFVNEAFARMVGYTVEEVIGMDFRELVAPEDLEMVADRYHRRQVGEDVPREYEFRALHKDGVTRVFVNMNVGLVTYRGKVASMGTLKDITERKRAEEALKRRATQLATVSEVGRQIASILELDELLRQIVNLFGDAFGYRYAYIFLVDEDSNELVLMAGAGPAGRVLEGTRIGVEARSINACVARSGKPLLANDVAKEPMYLLMEEVADTKSELAVPIKIKDAVIGTLDVQSTELNAFDESDLFTLQALANQAATAIENARLYEEQRRELAERKRTEEALRESEGRFRDIAENALEWIWEVDANGKYTYASPVVEKILGYKPEEVLKKHFYDLFHPQDRKELKKAAFEVFAKKQPFREFVNRNVHKNGKTVWLSTSGVPILDEKGNLLGYRGVDTDITERERVQREIEERRLYLEGLLTAAPDAIVTLDPRHRIVEWNPGAERLFGYSREEAIGRDIDDLITSADTYEEALGYTEMVMSGTELPPVEAIRYRKDGSPVDVIVAGSPIVVGGELKGLVAVYTDVTERKRAEEEIGRRSEELAALNAIAETVSRSLDLDEVLNSALDKVLEITNFEAGGIALVDQAEGKLTPVTHRHVPEAFLATFTEPRAGGGFRWQTVESGESIFFEEIPHDPQLRGHAGLNKGFHAAAYIPLKARDRVVGFMGLGTRQEHHFTPEEKALLTTISNQIGIAIENARLYEEAQRRIGELSGLHEISEAFGSMTEVRETFGELTKRMAQLIGCQICVIGTYDDEAREMQAQPPGYGAPDELVHSFRYKVDAPGARDAWNFRLQGPLLANDIAQIPDFFSQWVEGFGLFNLLIVPMTIEGRITGLVYAANKPSGFAEDDAKLLTIFASQAAVIIENAHLYEETKRLAATDPLTGVWNRRHIEERLRTEGARARRFGHQLSVLVMDIDNLKLFNDTYGHPAGDKVICTVAQVVLTSCRETDIVGRYGGDEFAILLPETDTQGAIMVAGRILAALKKEPFRAPDGTKVPINISIGTASYPSDSDKADRLFSLADAAMYRVKVAGGGQFASLTAGPEEIPEELVAPFDVLQGLLIAVDSKDRYTFKHSQEVTERALALARMMGLSEEEVRALEVAGRLHDVGKIGIPANVLRKPGALTPEEWKMIQEHPRLGYLILQQLPQMELILDAVLHHHERWDGNGYPDGMKDGEIPRLARILAIADAYSAMLTDRPYRKALSQEEALQEVQNCAGTQFDPELAEIFIDLISSKQEQQD